MQFSYVYDDRVYVYCCSGVECHESTRQHVCNWRKRPTLHTQRAVVVEDVTSFLCFVFFFSHFLEFASLLLLLIFFPISFLVGLCFIPLNLKFSRFVYLFARLHYGWVSHHHITSELIESSVSFHFFSLLFHLVFQWYYSFFYSSSFIQLL